MQKLVIRADDVGYTPVGNIGVFETFDKGYSTSADVMLESPGTLDALRRLREYRGSASAGTPISGTARCCRPARCPAW